MFTSFLAWMPLIAELFTLTQHITDSVLRGGRHVLSDACLTTVNFCSASRTSCRHALPHAAVSLTCAAPEPRAEHLDLLRWHREALRLRLCARHVMQDDGADLHQGHAAVHGAGAGPGAALQPHGAPMHYTIGMLGKTHI